MINNPFKQAALETLTRLAERFPVFRPQPWERHQPLKVGVDKDIIASGFEIDPLELGKALRFYCGRPMYQEALARGGPRYTLQGEPVGEVTTDQVHGAKKLVERFERKRDEAAKEAKAKAQAAREARRKGAQEAQAVPEAPIPAEPEPVPASPPGPKKLGLADLKRAALQRRKVA
jgi:sRNA-binding protein